MPSPRGNEEGVPPCIPAQIDWLVPVQRQQLLQEDKGKDKGGQQQQKSLQPWGVMPNLFQLAAPIPPTLDLSPFIKWDRVVQAMVVATRQNFPQSPDYHHENPSAWYQFWSEVFKELEMSVLLDPLVPRELTYPVVLQEFHVVFFNRRPQFGARSLPEVAPNLTINNLEEINKVGLVKNIGRHLYPVAGGYLPFLYFLDENLSNPSPQVHGTRDFYPLLIYGADLMDSEKLQVPFDFYLDPLSQLVGPVLRLYCCHPDVFEACVQDFHAIPKF
jgi:hypothetical protein